MMKNGEQVSMIHFGIRQSFDKIEQVEDIYANLSAPVELALP
jgi:hypothetical protein